MAKAKLEQTLKDEEKKLKKMRQFKARPLPEGSPFRVERTISDQSGFASSLESSGRSYFSQTAHLTEPVGFALRTDERGRLKQEQLEARLRQEQEKERSMRHFHARPLRCGSPFSVEPSQDILTEPHPFVLATDQRGGIKSSTLREALSQQQALDQEKRLFKALPLPASTTNPAPMPVLSQRALTVVSDFVLNSDERARQRHAFDEHIKLKEQKMAEQRKQAELQREKQERKEVKKLRRKLVHKPLPLPSSLCSAASSSLSSGCRMSQIPLTEPQSPQLRTKVRRQRHHQSNITSQATNMRFSFL